MKICLALLLRFVHHPFCLYVYATFYLYFRWLITYSSNIFASFHYGFSSSICLVFGVSGLFQSYRSLLLVRLLFVDPSLDFLTLIDWFYVFIWSYCADHTRCCSCGLCDFSICVTSDFNATCAFKTPFPAFVVIHSLYS